MDWRGGICQKPPYLLVITSQKPPYLLENIHIISSVTVNFIVQ